jgi:hypothetical protein
MQRLNSCAPGCCTPDDEHKIITPSEVTRPTLATWVEERNDAPGLWVSGMGLIPFIPVAPAGKG